LNAYAEHWVRSVKDECRSKIIPFGERSLRAMKDYVAHDHLERNHQGKNNVLLFHRSTKTNRDKRVRCHERLRGLLRYYHRKAARIVGEARRRLGLTFQRREASLQMHRYAPSCASRFRTDLQPYAFWRIARRPTTCNAWV
jgi:hypothetical protein